MRAEQFLSLDTSLLFIGFWGLRVSGSPMTSWNDVREGLRVSEMTSQGGAPGLRDDVTRRDSGSPSKAKHAGKGLQAPGMDSQTGLQDLRHVP